MIARNKKTPARDAATSDVTIPAPASASGVEETAPGIKITALILSYNSAPALRRCLTALEASQGREQIEIIVVDCGSMDESATLDTEFPGVTVLRMPRNFGATKALNIGMRTAAADYVFWLAPEVLVEPATVMALAAELDGDESLAAACPLLIDETGHPQTRVPRLPGPDAMRTLWRNPDALAFTTIDPAQPSVPIEYPDRKALAARKFFVKAINWLDERYGEFGGDLELAFQIRRSQKKILLFPGIRATLAQTAAPPFDTAALATLAADRAHGISVFLSKHSGFMAGLLFRAGAILSVSGHLLTLQQPAFQLRQLTALISGQKIDGSQQTL